MFAVVQSVVIPVVGQLIVVVAVVLTGWGVVAVVRKTMAERLEQVAAVLASAKALLFLMEQHAQRGDMQKAQTQKELEAIKQKVDVVPKETAALVSEDVVKATQLAHDSHDGTTLRAPQYTPPKGSV